MRIAMVGQKGIPTRFGGIERHVEELALRLGAMGHEVLVYSRAWYAVADANFAPGVRAVTTPTIRTKHLDAVVHTFTSTIHAIRAGVDVIHYHGVGPSLLSWIPRIFAPRVTVVTTFHCIDRRLRKWGWFARLALGTGEWAACNFPHATIAVSRTLQAYCRDRYERAARYIPNGVAEPAADIGTDTLAQFGLEPGRYLALVSRLIPDKRADLLIQAFLDLKRRGLMNGLKLAIVGGSSFTDGHVRELMELAGGDPDIVFTGYRQGRELDQLFANCYALVHPSASEGMPVAVIEAMVHGKTVLASDIPEICEVTRDHGLNFKNGSLADLTRKLRMVIENPAITAEIGVKAKKFVLDNFRWDEAAKDTVGLYAELTNEAAAVIETENRPVTP